MITIDLTEQVVEAEADYNTDTLVRLITCGVADNSDTVRMVGGNEIKVDFANRVTSKDRPDYVVRERSLIEAGEYEIVSMYRGGHPRRFTFRVGLQGDTFRVVVDSAEATSWIYGDDALRAGPPGGLTLAVPLAETPDHA